MGPIFTDKTRPIPISRPPRQKEHGCTMMKCEFCEMSLPNGECRWENSARQADCERAIKRMMLVMGGGSTR